MSSASIEEVRSRLDIVDVVSQSVPLKKAGRNFKAPCPFHNEKTPSFVVNPERQTWHCFGACGTGGDAFSFVMKREGLEFGEALRTLAEKVGITLETRDKKAESKTSRLLEANKAAAAFFHHQLLTDRTAAEARKYVQKRGLSSEMVTAFQLGYCPPASGALFKNLSQHGFSRDECADAGLGTRNEAGEVRDIFRGRLMFPIRDPRGRVIGFGGRAMSDSGPKYINSPQTPIFDKSGTLYGADRAREAARQLKRAVVVEGYMDVITAHQFGFENVVASMGTSLTERQVEVLKRLCSRISLALDADTAGQEATLRSLKSSWQSFYRSVHPLQGSRRQRFLEGPPDQTVDIVMMPAGEDPDSIIRKDRDRWVSLLDSPTALIDYLMEMEVGRANLDAPGARASILEEFRGLLVTTDFLDQEVYVRKLARLMDVSEDTVKAAINAPANNSVRQPRAPTPRSRTRPQPTPTPRRGDKLEEYVLSILLRNPSLISNMEDADPEWFVDLANREIFKRLAAGHRFEDLADSSPDEFAEPLARIRNTHVPADSDELLTRGLKEGSTRLEVRHLKRLKLEEKSLLEDQDSLQDMADAIDQRKLSTNKELKRVYS